MENKIKNNTGKVIAIGASIAAVVAAGYFFFGPDGKKHQKKLKGWMIKMKGEIIEKIESMQDITKEAYDTVVDTVSSAYVKVGGKEEVAKLAKELKSHWKAISSKAIMKEKTGKKVNNKK